jgi:hypothetical protein
VFAAVSGKVYSQSCPEIACMMGVRPVKWANPMKGEMKPRDCLGQTLW